jgi:hypothetical protein
VGFTEGGKQSDDMGLHGQFLFQKYSFILLRWKGNHPRSNIDDVDDPASGTSAIVLNACIRLDRAY